MRIKRRHRRVARARAHPSRSGTGRFFLIDLSTLGTTLNGLHDAAGYDEADGSKRENGVEVPLPETARIGLADMVFLDFRGASRHRDLVAPAARFVLLLLLVAAASPLVWAAVRASRGMKRIDAGRQHASRGGRQRPRASSASSTRIAVHCDARRGIFIVIDGVGGQAAGGKAADVALAMLRARLERETGPVEDRIREAIAIANNEIYRLAATRPEWKGMACVLTVAVVDDGDVDRSATSATRGSTRFGAAESRR